MLMRMPVRMVGAAAGRITCSHQSGAHNSLFPRVLQLLNEQGAGDVTLFGGGIIPDDDVPRLKAAGVQMLFRPATPMHDIVDFVKGLRVER